MASYLFKKIILDGGFYVGFKRYILKFHTSILWCWKCQIFNHQEKNYPNETYCVNYGDKH